MGSALSVLSIVRVTSARPSGGRPAVPAKMTSSILPPRSALAPCSPSTQAMASTTLLLPDPLGPTTAVIPGSSRSVVAEAKDLKPRRVRDLRCTGLRRSDGGPRSVRATTYLARPVTPRRHAAPHGSVPASTTGVVTGSVSDSTTRVVEAHKRRALCQGGLGVPGELVQ